MKKPETISANTQTRNAIISDTLWKIRDLLNATRTLLNDVKEEEEVNGIQITEGDPTIPAGLYTFAVEEFGKFLYLNSLEPIDGKYEIDYINEFTNHPKKFEHALSALPDECKLINLGEKEHTEFYEPDYHDDIIADFETRLRIFYSDFDPYFANKVTKTSPPVSVKLLKTATEKLLDITESLEEDFYKHKDSQ